MTLALPPRGGTRPMGQGMAAAARNEWQIDDTERWLTDWPLPATFKWNGARAYPRYTAKKGYGFWLRTAGPYHPALRGLFMLCHRMLATLRAGVDPMPSGEQLAAMLQKEQRPAAELPWSEEDRAAIEPGTLNPAENVPAMDSPTTTHGEPNAEPDALAD